ncbi:MAG: hypothetical protein HUU54_15415 [Ignavibacteriaceae bacterium]|nr:hypothetical protein [Ignavibacteriaceae bacterium]
MKNILFYSPDLNLLSNLMMYFNDRYSVTTTTNLSTLSRIVSSKEFDLLILDAEPTEKVEKICEEIKTSENPVPVILTYVFTSQLKNMDHRIRRVIDAIFYKPIDLKEVTEKISNMLAPAG